MTLQEALNQIAVENGYKDYSSMDRKLYSIGERKLRVQRYNDAVKLYASEKIKQALQLAADRATTKMSMGRNGCKIVVDPESILSLADELIEQINKEI